MSNIVQEEIPVIPDYLKDLMEKGDLTDNITLDEEGVWHHNDVPITNDRIIDFFNKSINITENGEYVIHYKDYTYPITVLDVPIFITGIRYEGFGDFEKVYLNLSAGATEELNINSLIFKQNNALYCSVKGGKFSAKFKRSPSFHILERLDEKNNQYYLNICGKSIILNRE